MLKLNSKSLRFAAQGLLLLSLSWFHPSGVANQEFGSESSSPTCTQLAEAKRIPREHLYQAMLLIKATGNLDLLTPSVLHELGAMVQMSPNELREPEALRRLDILLTTDWHGKVQVKENLISLGRTVDQISDMSSGPRRDDSRDFHRDWGWHLLRRDDPIFSHPDYLLKYMQQRHATGSGYVNDPVRVRELFNEEWKKLAPANVHIEAFTQTGSDANSLLLSVNERSRGFDYNPNLKRGRILVFEGVYGGTRGEVARFHNAGLYANNELPNTDIIPNPQATSMAPRNSKELKRVQEVEENALAFIRQQVETNPNEVRGVFMEPMSGNIFSRVGPVTFYRPEFLVRLRQLCDELGLFIIADEILTGGGRTGKFFAYQHYQGFEPDYITFGKGLQVAGVAKVSRGSRVYHDGKMTGTTLYAPSDALLKGAFILRKIREEKLMKNAEENGAYLVAQLKKKDPTARGVGFFIYAGRGSPLGGYGPSGRILPYLSLQKSEIDEILQAAQSQR